MTYIAFRMLTGDRAKYIGLILAVGFSAFLMSHQSSIFAGLMRRTTSQIVDVVDADIWVMDPQTQYFDEIKALTDSDLYRVRDTPGVAWAVRLYKGLARATAPDGRFRTVILLGLDDFSMVGAPRTLIAGSVRDLRSPDAVIIDEAGYRFFFPTGPLRVGGEFEMNDRRARIVGICQASPPFQTFPVMYTRYSQALTYVGRERNLLSFVLAGVAPGVSAADVSSRIVKNTGLKALPTTGFAWATIHYYLSETGIPINFGITVFLAVLIGVLVAGQTFYLFTLENLKHFATLKAMGVSNRRLVGMILSQAALVGLQGFSFGLAGTAAFFLSTRNVLHLRGFSMLPEIAIGAGVITAVIIVAASLISIRRVLVLEPAVVFRG